MPQTQKEEKEWAERQEAVSSRLCWMPWRLATKPRLFCREWPLEMAAACSLSPNTFAAAPQMRRYARLRPAWSLLLWHHAATPSWSSGNIATPVSSERRWGWESQLGLCSGKSCTSPRSRRTSKRLKPRTGTTLDGAAGSRSSAVVASHGVLSERWHGGCSKKAGRGICGPSASRSTWCVMCPLAQLLTTSCCVPGGGIHSAVLNLKRRANPCS
mmetsp:Transcript_17077/g.42699  ORF Transcript_17077/g.42699 Transcript_17077/m.42699 type:complete len:214 (-) Transcript_17077:934-1575(-)